MRAYLVCVAFGVVATAVCADDNVSPAPGAEHIIVTPSPSSDAVLVQPGRDLPNYPDGVSTRHEFPAPPSINEVPEDNMTIDNSLQNEGNGSN
ncbi:hypothetical protein D9M69_503310 [compost metagenome]